MLMLTLTHSFLHKEMPGWYMVENQEQIQIFNPHTSIPEWDYLLLLQVLLEEQFHQLAVKEEKR